MCNFKRSRIAYKWQRRAEQLFEEGYGDCDKISYKLVDEMQAQGLEISKDFVIVRGRIGKTQHMCLEMYGRNKNFPQLNGYRIDGTAKNANMKVNFKGPYGT